jgi:membrane protein
MARLRDVPLVVRRVGFVRFARRVYGEVLDDHLFLYSAALAYAWLFAIFPFFIFLVNLAPVFLGPDPADRVRKVEYFLRAALPDAAVRAFLQGPILDALEHPRGGLLSLSLLIALWAASNGIAVTMAVLDKCYEIERPRAYYKRRPMAFALTLACASLVFCVLLLLPVGQTFRAWYLEGAAVTGRVDRAVLLTFDVARVTLAVVAVFGILAILYHFGPCVRHRWRALTPGSVFCFAVWIALGLGFKYYAIHFGRYHQTYGNVGGVAILLVLFYLDALVLLIGAEINSEIDFEVLKVKRGSRDFLTAEDAKPPRVEAPVGAPAAEI